jgi:Ca2+-transporting ATPase
VESASGVGKDSQTHAQCSLDQLYLDFLSRPDGLSEKEAAERLKGEGPNSLPERRKKPWQDLISQFKNLFNILLIIAAVLCFISGYTANDSSTINMGVVILLVVALSIIFNLFQEHRAEKAVQAIRGLIPMNAKVRREGQVKQIPVTDVVPGDVLILEAGDKVCADARVTTSFELSVDNSSLTGESEPQLRSASSLTSPPRELVSCSNLVFAGTIVASGSAEALIIATGTKTEFGRVVSLTHTITEPLSPLQLELNRTAKLNFIVAVAVGAAFLLIALFGLQLELSASLLFMIGVMVSLVPEGFQVTLTLALALSSLNMSKRHVVVKRLSSVETLGSVTVICTDKTGTITEGQMTVKKIWIGGVDFDVTGEGYEPEGSVLIENKRVMARDREDLLRLCEISSLDNTSTLVPPLDRRKSRWSAVGDSTEAALLSMTAKAGISNKEMLAKYPRIGMIPFESSRKMMTSVHRNPDGEIIAYVKGASSEVLARSKSIYWQGKIIPLTEDISNEVRIRTDSYAREAYRVLGLAIRSLSEAPTEFKSELIESDLTFVGLVAILDPPRAETAEAVRLARSAGTRIVMMTGDHELTAEAIARKVGIITSPKSEVVTGNALSQMSDEELLKVLDKPELVFARISPDQKLRIVRLLRQKGESVAVTGDGVNDAPALLEADIGISMGLSGTDVARESSDMVLLDDNFASIVNGIEQGRAVYDNLKKFIVYVFAHNWAELISFIVFVLLGTPLPLTVLMILAIDLVLEIPPSLALTMEPPEPGIMDRSPRSKSERLFSPYALARSAYIGIIIGVASVLWCFSIWSQAGWSLGMSTVPDEMVYLEGTTVTMAAIMAGQLGTLLSTRTNVRSALSVSITKNKWLLVGIAASFLMLISIIYIPFLGEIFSTTSFDPLILAMLYLVAPLIFALEEVRKYVLRSYILPAKPVVARPVLAPLATIGKVPFASTPKELPPFEERSSPVFLPINIVDWKVDTIRYAASIARHAGSRLIILRIMEEEANDQMILDLEDSAENVTTPIGVPFEFMELRLIGKEHSSGTKVSSLRDAIKQAGPDWIILPVGKEVFQGKRSSLRMIRWIEDLPEKRVVLLSNWQVRTIEGSSPRVLIPVLDKFESEPFEIAEALTEGANIPDVNVVVAKVVEIPPIVPLYSIYKPESLVNAERELATYASLPKWALIRRIRPMVLLVRSASRDVAQFIIERKVDVVILEGNWGRGRDGYLDKKEQKIATSSECSLIVTLPKRGK